ncbi:CPSF A subunit region-domain-containing protein, partial [Gymnopilus junonius]
MGSYLSYLDISALEDVVDDPYPPAEDFWLSEVAKKILNTMHSLRQEILPPSGVEFATSLKLTPSCLSAPKPTTTSDSTNVSTRHEFVSRVICNLIVARSNLLRIFEVREEPAPIDPQTDEFEREKRSGAVRRGTEAVEGEVEMDDGGDGYINIAKPVSQKSPAHISTVTRFYLVKEHRLHGIITGIEGVRLVSSLEDHLDRLLVSFKDAKIALLEWSDEIHDLITVSIHTYERAPQLLALDSPLFRAELRVDPLSRCAALSLPKHALAILPFYQSQSELVEVMDIDPETGADRGQDAMQARGDVPYAPSFILDLPAQVETNLRNVIDFVFLPGFNNPTMAILFQTQQTWTGRLKEFKDTCKLLIFTLDHASQHYPIITSVENLPYDCLYLLPCSTSIGGVIITTSNALLYIDQSSSRRIVLPLNGWTARTSDIPTLPLTTQLEKERKLHLEGSRTVFVDDKTFFLILKDGTVYPVEIVADGRTVSKLSMAPPLAQTAVPMVLRNIGEDHIFVGSSAGPSVLLKAAHVQEEVQENGDVGEGENGAALSAVVKDDNDMDYDDEDEDLYGVSSSKNITASANGTPGPGQTVSTKKMRTVIHLSLRDFLPAHGPITSMAFSLAKNGDRPVPELVTTTGSGPTGGFTLFQRDLPIQIKRKIHAIGGARGLWSLPIRQPVKQGGIQYERPLQSYGGEGSDTMVLSTDGTPSPGLSRIATRLAKSDVSITTRIPGTTIGAAPFFQRTAILHVMTNAIRVLEPDGTERQIIKDMDGNMPRPKIRTCSISDPFVLIVREDDSIGLFIGETERGKIRRKDMSPMGDKRKDLPSKGDKTSRYLTGCFYSDITDLFETQYESSVSPAGGVTSTLQAAVNAGSKSQWLILMRPQGIMEIWTLPKLTLAFSTDGLSTLQNVLVDSHDPPAVSLPQDPPRKPQDLDVEQLLLAPIGESSPRPHLCVFLRSGQLTIYEVVPAGKNVKPEPQEKPLRASHLDIIFVKIASIAFEIQRQEETEKSILAEQKKISRMFIPFVTSPSGSGSGSSSTASTTYSGVFFTGDRPNWIMGTNKSGVQIYPSGHSVVHAFTSCSLWESKGDFLLYTEEGPCLLEWVPNFQLDGPLPSRSIPRGRSYSNVLFDPSTSLIVAASSLQAKFTSYDEDGNRIWEPDAPNITDPMCDCSTLELISPDFWMTLDGFEFATNEYVNDVACVTLETSSTESGSKDFIATYIFEIVEVVPDPSVAPKRWYKLRLRCRDDAKGPVSAVCGFSGYLISSMGQKVFVRAFDSDERLVGVAFMDVGVYVTSLRTLKNFLLVGDAVKSVMFVAFQEDPYKLVLLAKDTKRICVTFADFFFTDGELSIVTGDEEGILRVYEYNPQDPDSNDGRHLLLRTEYHAQSEARSTFTIARRTKEDLIFLNLNCCW